MLVELLLSTGIVYGYSQLGNKNERYIRSRLKSFIEEKEIFNKKDIRARIEDIEIFSWGFKVALAINGICSYKEIEGHEDYLKQLFKAKEVELTNFKGKAVLEVITNYIEDIEYKPIELPPTSLLLGFDSKGEPVIVDMLKVPHMGVQGASNSGKSKMVQLSLKNLRGAEIVLLNVFDKDFIGVQGRRINGNDNILKFLQSLIENHEVKKKPFYLILDELNVLGKDKAINKAITDVLSQARHFNIYLIALGQSLLKENCPYKQLFNVRVTFRTIDKSSISAFLGCSMEDNELLQREFICYSDKIYRGKSYLC